MVQVGCPHAQGAADWQGADQQDWEPHDCELLIMLLPPSGNSQLQAEVSWSCLTTFKSKMNSNQTVPKCLNCIL